MLGKDVKNKLDWKKNKWEHLKDNRRQTSIDMLKIRRWPMSRHRDELHSLKIKGLIGKSWSRGRPKMRYIRQIMKNAGVISYRELTKMAKDWEIRREHLLWIHLFTPIYRLKNKKIKNSNSGLGLQVFTV